MLKLQKGLYPPFYGKLTNKFAPFGMIPNKNYYICTRKG